MNKSVFREMMSDICMESAIKSRDTVVFMAALITLAGR